MAAVVSDASPLICLAAIRHFDLLRQLYGEVLIPEVVWQEITRAPAFAAAASLEVAANARDAGWVQVVTAGNRPLVTQLETTLDRGEAEAIALAVERVTRALRNTSPAKAIADDFGHGPVSGAEIECIGSGVAEIGEEHGKEPLAE